MRKLFLVVISLFIMAFSSVASAEEGDRHNWSHHAYQRDNWRQVHEAREEPFPFKWHERLDYYSASYHMKPIHERKHEWRKNFPGLQPYSFHGSFWYHGNRITNAVMFYNDSNELVSIGFLNNGAFTLIRDDRRSFETQDPSIHSLFNIIVNMNK